MTLPTGIKKTYREGAGAAIKDTGYITLLCSENPEKHTVSDVMETVYLPRT
jgi:hypothetical protein